MKRRPKLISTIVIIAAVFSTMVAHKATPRKRQHIFVMMDSDKDGKVSKREYLTFMEAEFDRLDNHRRGKLGPNELAQSRLQVISFTFARK